MSKKKNSVNMFEISNLYKSLIDDVGIVEINNLKKKMKDDFYENFVGTKKELEKEESLLSFKIEKEVQKLLPKLNKKKIALEEEMKEKIRKSMSEPFSINKEAFDVIWHHAEESADYHSYSDILNYLDDYGTLYINIQKTLR